MNSSEIQLQYNALKANGTVIWLLFLFLGWSYGSMKQIGIQFLYYVTLGGFGFWALYRLFTLNKAIKDYNRNIALSLDMDTKGLALNGLI